MTTDSWAPEAYWEHATFLKANPVQRGLRRVAGTTPGAWLFARVLHRIDRPVYRATRGRHTVANLLSGLPVVLLTTTGARTGAERTVPIVGFPVPEGLAVIASNFGQVHHPGWYHNLRAHPEATVTIRGVRRPVSAVEADGELRERILQEGLRFYPGWSFYERHAGARRIGVFVLQPPGEDGGRRGQPSPSS